jgi:hypothetical protein
MSDAERLRMEIEYCRLCSSSYSMNLDFTILSRTVLSLLGMRRFLRPDEVFGLMARRTPTADIRPFEATESFLSRLRPGKRSVPD